MDRHEARTCNVGDPVWCVLNGAVTQVSIERMDLKGSVESGNFNINFYVSPMKRNKVAIYPLRHTHIFTSEEEAGNSLAAVRKEFEKKRKKEEVNYANSFKRGI